MSALDNVLPASRLCACGCGGIVEGPRRKKYATLECRRRAAWLRYSPRAKQLRRKT